MEPQKFIKIICKLDKLAESSFKNDGIDLKLINIARSVKELSGDISERLSYIKNTDSTIATHLESIQNIALCIETLCEVFEDNVNSTDFGIIADLISLRNEMIL